MCLHTELRNLLEHVQHNKHRIRFDELQSAITTRLKEFGIEPLGVIPISAQLGDNMASASENLAWFKGKTLLNALDELQHIGKAEDAPLRFPLQDIYDEDGEKVLVGKMVSGTLNKGQEVIFHPCGKLTRIKEIKQFGKSPESVGPGESIGITIEEGIAIKALKRGEIACCVEPSPNISNRINATVFWMSGEPLEAGEELELKCATQQLTCKVRKIQNRMNSSSLEVMEETADELADTEVAKLTISTEDYLCTDPFEQIEETGRFVLMRDGDTVAGGVLH